MVFRSYRARYRNRSPNMPNTQRTSTAVPAWNTSSMVRTYPLPSSWPTLRTSSIPPAAFSANDAEQQTLEKAQPSDLAPKARPVKPSRGVSRTVEMKIWLEPECVCVCVCLCTPFALHYLKIEMEERKHTVSHRDEVISARDRTPCTFTPHCVSFLEAKFELHRARAR